MFESHFGLKSNPFGAKAKAGGVFVGPRQIEMIGRIQNGLRSQDAVITVTGTVGVGKTTLITRALEQMSPGRTAAWVGRMQLGAEDLVELLLAGFGIKSKSKGPVRRYAAFRRLMQIQADAGAQVAIIVEDAHRIGVDALDELEALTAADGTDTAGANVILMGQPHLGEFLGAPELARLAQRTRLRQTIDAFSAPEVQGYLKHVVRHAGGDFDKLFDAGTVEIVHRATGGIPRMINTLCAAALTAAMEAGSRRVSAAQIEQVAVEAFGYDPSQFPPLEKAAAPEPTPAVEPQPPVDEDAESALPKAARNVVVESGRYPDPDAPAPAVAADPEPVELDAQLPADVAEPTPAADVAEDTTATEFPDAVAAADAAEEADAPAVTVDEAASVPADAASTIDQPAPEVDVPDVPEPGAKAEAHAPQPEPEIAEEDIPELIDDTQPELAKLDEATLGAAAAAGDDVPKLTETVAAKAATAANEDTAEETADDAESTAKQKKPDARDFAEQAAIAAARDAQDAAAEIAASAADNEPEPEYGLDDVLAPDNDSTNMMEALTPDLESVAAELPAADSAPADEPSLPTLSDSMRIDTPAAQTTAPAEAPAPAAKATPEAPAAPPPAVELPEITLDKALEAKAESNPKYEKFAEEISKANSLEDISELMAETLFGDEDLDRIAAEVAASRPTEPGEGAADQPAAKADAPAADLPPAARQPKIDPVATGEIELTLEMDDASAKEPPSAVPAASAAEPQPPAAKAPPKPAAPPKSVDVPAPQPDESHGLRESVAMRIEMLNKLKGGSGEAPAPKAPAASPQPSKPESIEEQITTSMTATLKALKATKPVEDTDDEADEKDGKKSGLFSRFRRSS